MSLVTFPINKKTINSYTGNCNKQEITGNNKVTLSAKRAEYINELLGIEEGQKGKEK